MVKRTSRSRSKSGSWLIMGCAGTLLVTSAIEVVQMANQCRTQPHIVKLLLRPELSGAPVR